MKILIRLFLTPLQKILTSTLTLVTALSHAKNCIFDKKIMVDYMTRYLGL